MIVKYLVLEMIHKIHGFSCPIPFVLANGNPLCLDSLLVNRDVIMLLRHTCFVSDFLFVIQLSVYNPSIFIIQVFEIILSRTLFPLISIFTLILPIFWIPLKNKFLLDPLNHSVMN
jgi:hypothetical protein